MTVLPDATAHRPTVRHDRPGRQQTPFPDDAPSRLHLLRLCLDLQLEAFQVAAGAAAAEETDRSAPWAAAAGSTAVPWHDWLTEDVDMVLDLAHSMVLGHVALPGPLAAGAQGSSRASAIGSLRARYEAMQGLLGELVAADRSADREPLVRCRQRLSDLRIAETSPGSDRSGHDREPTMPSLPGYYIG